mgnify:CR=1 FL=1
MLKPNDYEQVKAYGEYKPLRLGGHICKIIKVEETFSRSQRPMLNIYLDIADGEQKGYFKNQYDRDDRPDKKWGCIVYQLKRDNEGHTHRGFKTFITCVEKSNPGFTVVWGDEFSKCFTGKFIGGVFGREQYRNTYGELKWSTKCLNFRSVETIRKGVDIPEDKYLKDTAPKAASNDFEEVTGDDELPF